MKDKLGYDDSLDCFGIHGIGSGLGVLILGFFARPLWVEAQGADWTAMGQFFTQLKGMGVTIALAAVVTIILCVIIEKTVGFRLDEAAEQAGLDHDQHGEHGYGLLNLN